MPNWHALPFARLLLLFISAIFLQSYVQLRCAYLLGLLLTLIIVLYLSNKLSLKAHLRSQHGKGILVLAFLLSSFLVLLITKDDKQSQKHYLNKSNPICFQIKITSEPKIKGRQLKAYAEIETGFDKFGLKQACHGNILISIPYTDSNNLPKRGDYYLIPNHLRNIREPSDASTFNYKQYLARRQIYRQTLLKNGQYIFLPGKKDDLIAKSESIRRYFLKPIKEYIADKKSQSIVEALVLGYKGDLNKETNLLFSSSGTMHVLAVSGLHTGMIYMILMLLLSPLKKLKKGKFLVNCLLIIGLWSYAMITGLSASVIRAALMLSLITIAEIFNFRKSTFNNIYASACMMLLYNPNYIFDIGFQLSYAAVLGIVYLNPKLRIINRFQNKIVRYIIDLSIISFCAQIFTFPLCLYYFHQFPTYFLISNLLVIPIFTGLLVLGIILICSSWIPFLAIKIGLFAHLIIQTVIHFLKAQAEWPFSTLVYTEFNGSDAIVTYLLLFSILAFFDSKKFIYFLGIQLMLICLVTGHTAKKMVSKNLKTIEYVKHRNSLILICRNNRKTYLISDSLTLQNLSQNLTPIRQLNRNEFSDLILVNCKKVFVSTNLILLPNQGFQFFDKIMTIKNTVHFNVQNQNY